MRPAEGEIQKTRDKLIYISMGTVNNNLLPLYKSCISAFKGGEYQVIMSIGEQVQRQELGELSENIEVYSRVDQIGVLEKADVFISHCGMNSASESLYYGVPLVLLPRTPEQGTVAERVRQLGAGIKPENTGAEAIARAVETLLADGSYRERAREIGAGFRSCKGAAAAADKILSVCRKE